MNTKQGARGAISHYRAKPAFCGFSLVFHTMCAVNESVCMALCRCRNSRGIVVSSRLPMLRFGLTDTDI